MHELRVPTPTVAETLTTDVAYDELRDPGGKLRPHWQRYFDHLEQIGDREAKTRWTKVKQLLQENGVSYNVYGDSQQVEHPWRLSPIPLLLAPCEWEQLARGIAQRARLLGVLLADLYGPQRVLREGDLPSQLVFDNPQFLRPLHGIGTKGNGWLPLFGVDLVRAPNGRFHALADLTQAPEGVGYAIENRTVVAHVMPDLMGQCNVERLGPFVQLLRDRLQSLAPHNRDAPRVALLTPGPISATYFEQAYLAKVLGLTLVQGEDLTVRDDRVYSKTLGGLQPIDVLLRRVADDYCDPLELRAESELGIPGLVQAVRSGNVAALNPLGCGVLETPGLLAYLPGLCRKLLNEDLLLPSVPTYYCGDATHLEQVLGEFEHMVIKSTHGATRTDSTFVRLLDAMQRLELRERIIAAPHQFVAQRFVPSSKTPVITAGALHARALVLRCFACCNDGSDYQVMPGGLALVATNDADFAVSMRHGARSKDVWVVADRPVLESSLQPPATSAIALSRGGGDLPSRVADNLYWLGRYAERAESVARLARVIGTKLLDLPSTGDLAQSAEIARLMLALRLQTQFVYTGELPSPGVVSRATCELEFGAAVVDTEIGGSVLCAAAAALRVGKVVRDRLSLDTWHILASLDDAIQGLQGIAARAGIPRLLDELNHIIIKLATFSGLVMESMTRGFAWQFLDMGRRLERALALVVLMRATLVDRCERQVPLLEAVLDVADSGMTYRRRHAASLQAAPVVDLLLADDSNPRGVIFQLKTLGEHIAALPTVTAEGVRSAQQRFILSATSQIELSDIDDLCRPDPTSNRRGVLHALLNQLGTVLPALSDSLTETYLYHASVARQLNNGDTQSSGVPGSGTRATS